MTKKKFFKIAGIMTAMVGMTVAGALCMGNAAASGPVDESARAAVPFKVSTVAPVHLCHVCGDGVVERDYYLPATQTADGVESYTCNSCGYHYENELPAISTDTDEKGAASDLKAAANSTAEIAPLKVEVPLPTVLCPECGEAFVTYVSTASCTSAGTITYGACDYCSFNGSTEDVGPFGHNMVNADALEPTCTEDGHTAGTFCSRSGCDYVTYEIIPALGHTAGETSVLVPPTCTTGGSGTSHCIRCNTQLTVPIAKLGHDFSDYVVTVAPTCIEKGEEKRTCQRSGCGYSETREVDELDHDLLHHEAQDPTCTEVGWEAYDECQREGCDYTTYEEIPALGHKYTNNGNGTIDEVTDDDGIVTKEPTCTEKGVLSYFCLRCDEGRVDEDIPALEHDFEVIEAVEPTCTEEGSTSARQCTRCGEYYGGVEPTPVPALDHDWGEWKEERESCDVAGERTRTCKRCGEEENEIIPAGEHSWDKGVVKEPATCTESGIKVVTCTFCGETSEEIIEATGHKSAKLAAVSPTCTETGLTEGERCTACGITLKAQQLVPATGHSLQHFKAVEPTDTTGGNIEYWQCKTCGVYFADAEAKTEISAEDTLLAPGESVEEGMSGWQIALAVVAGVAVLVVIGLLVDKFFLGDNLSKAINKSGSKSKKG